MAEPHDIWPVLLCGGAGTRLWPLSRADMPKQLQALTHEQTMLQATARRVAVEAPGLRFRPPLVVAGEDHRFLVADQLGEAGIEPAAILLEPEGRNTAPAIALAAQWHLAQGRPEALLLVMPSDHLIRHEEAFRAAVAVAAPVARAGRLVTFGVRPSEPATGYGYIEAEGQGAVRSVRRFVEKPDAATAARYLAQGLMWNAGIFLMRADAFLKALAAHAPDVASRCRKAATFRTEGPFVRPDRDAFVAVPAISVDYAVMERADNVAVVPVEMGWSDVGSWDALWRVLATDADGNVVRGAGTLIDCRDSLVRNDGGPFVAALGLEGMVVVSTADAVLIAPRGRTEEIRRVVERIEADGLDLARASAEVRRPWGSFRSLGRGQGWQVKRIAVRPGYKLSLQKHAHRAETWVVAAGRAIVTVDDEVRELGQGESVHIPVGAVHRLENPGPQVLELIEVQQGLYLGEDDIVRLADAYGRAST
ncbi:MAG: mannose-1-phosphate guanylyltransferase/mannose-6-phosphate isomerase [Sphingomonadaceae bacterium]|uniref:mannose-1-phosphate guanylyltransferase/mannose-6-phosphate isomerase n=1 Tax=Thermaurantiacus sp. TaxID=2820283 RepID=UPI00298EEE9F|nr:mannose-1-phosphate guanylyltransferase/mannose-6-phosphate isomerase [Thermaurantiacus sp.]MCS6987507.1 mannose-1-phosphate guanylyltransferase/mannose-6-phosphate isomerase [Sphingomonadaceae bacterium]MDW8415108.1 mannose-1-phosphate guanylyltransferase/mannose-6-phosphate isomerase [Thermaurantiacus sp.]